MQWLRAQIAVEKPPVILATLDRIAALIPRMSPDTREYFETARRSLRAGGSAQPELRALVNLLRGEPQFIPAQRPIFGTRVAADLLLREWDVPPPRLAAPELPSISIRWTEVTGEAGLSRVSVNGTAPVAAGDIKLAGMAGGAQGDQAHQGRPDLLLGSETDRVLQNDGERFRISDGVFAPGSAVLADFDNDFVLDAYVAGEHGDFVWRNPLRGDNSGRALRLTRTREKRGVRLAMAGRGPGTVTVADLDQDGDLDALRVSSDPGQPALRYWRNNGDWTFTDLTSRTGLRLPGDGAHQAVCADFDGDLSPDIFVAREQGCRLFLNRRQDVFQDASGPRGLSELPGACSAAVADYNRDGTWDVAVAAEAGSALYRNTGKRFESETLPFPAGQRADWIDCLDYDNDSWLDLVVAGTNGITLLKNDGGRFSLGPSPYTGAARWVLPLDYDLDGDVDLLIATADSRLKLLRNDGGNARSWLRVELQGYRIDSRQLSPGQATQGNNSYGIGATVEAVGLWDRQKVLVTRPVTHVGLGRTDKPLAARVLWTHGITEVNMAPGADLAVALVQRPTNSCPYLYTWDGEGWRFLKDFNWRSPLGMLQARGRPVPHHLTEDWVKVPAEWLAPIGGFYRLIATEELRELSYFDRLALLAVDHPPSTSIYVDERFPFGPADQFRVYASRNERVPISARNERGEDLLPALRSRDERYTPVPRPVLRGVCPPYELILDLGTVPNPGDVRLFLEGWLYPPPNSSNVAASQGTHITILPPSLQLGDGHGGWTEPDRTIGLPCGKRKTMVLDLGGRFKAGDYRVKLTTTYEIRWDRVFFTSGEAPVPVRLHPVPLFSADLQEHGIGEFYYGTAEGPDEHRYERTLTGEHDYRWKPIQGAYTRTGECASLLMAADDRYAIIGPGDEVRLVFDGRKLPRLPAGWKRDYVLQSDGWTKDTDPNTVTGESVEPLPFHGMKQYPYGSEERFPDTPTHRRWKRQWNTRIKHRR